MDDKDIDIRGYSLFLLFSDTLEASDNPASILLLSFCEVGKVYMQNENTITCDKILNASSNKSEFFWGAIVGMRGVGLKWDELTFMHK